MIKRIILFVAISFIISPEIFAQDRKINDRSGFYGGIGFLYQNDFFLSTKWEHYRLDISATAPNILIGYSRFLSGDNVGWLVNGGISWFHLPDISIELFPDSPVELQESKDYSNVKFSLITLDPSLVFSFGKDFYFDIGFSFGLQRNSQAIYEQDLLSDPFNPSQSKNTEREVFVVGGAGFGINYHVSNQIAIMTRARWIVGRQSGSGYAVYQNGSNLGDPYGSTEYMKQFSLGIIYKI